MKMFTVCIDIMTIMGVIDMGDVEYTACDRCGYMPYSLSDSVRHSIDGCE